MLLVQKNAKKRNTGEVSFYFLLNWNSNCNVIHTPSSAILLKKKSSVTECTFMYIGFHFGMPIERKFTPPVLPFSVVAERVLLNSLMLIFVAVLRNIIISRMN